MQISDQKRKDVRQYEAKVASKYSPIFKLISLISEEHLLGLLSLKIPPHLKCVATLLCEMSNGLKSYN